MPKLSRKNQALYNKLMKEARRIAREVPDNPTCTLYLYILRDTPRQVENMVCQELDKMGWLDLQVITTENIRARTFSRK